VNNGALVLASLPQVCEVCASKEMVRIAVLGTGLIGITNCLHCRWGVPVVHLPMRGDG
jgi:hypothetical protein